jgi:hypothetical protein
MDLKARDIVMDTILIILVGIQAFIILDELSDGKLSREMSVKIAYTRARIKTYIDREEAVRKQTGSVIFDAINTVEDAGKSDVTNPADEGDN